MTLGIQTLRQNTQAFYSRPSGGDETRMLEVQQDTGQTEPTGKYQIS